MNSFSLSHSHTQAHAHARTQHLDWFHVNLAFRMPFMLDRIVHGKNKRLDSQHQNSSKEGVGGFQLTFKLGPAIGNY